MKVVYGDTPQIVMKELTATPQQKKKGICAHKR